MLYSLTLLAGVVPDSVRAGDESDFEPNQLVCSMLPGGNIEDVNATYGTVTIETLAPATGVVSYLLAVPDSLDEDSLADVITLEPTVSYCAPNYLLGAPEPVQRSQPFVDVAGESEVTQQQAASRLQLTSVHAQTAGAGIRVAVIDVGTAADHPMLMGSVGTGYDYVDQDTIAQDEPAGFAGGHGTFVAGVVHLVAPDAEIIPYRVLDTLGRGHGFRIARAVIDAVEAGCRVINLSLVMSGKHPTLDAAIEYARDHDVVVVAAAGNDSSDVDRFPADDSYCLGVAALDSSDVLAEFSNYGSHVSLCAPGVDVKGPYIDSSYARWSGTSFAAPMVAATAALLVSTRPTASWNDIVDQLESTAEDVDAQNPGLEGELGFGMVSPLSALEGWLVAGDADASGEVTSADIVFLVNFVFKSGSAPVNMASADVNASCNVTASDILYLVNYVFRGGAEPLPGCVS